jgi:hypothetical protein
VNEGSFVKTAAAAPTQTVDVATDNSGTFNVNAVTLALTGGSPHAGNFNLAPGTHEHAGASLALRS